MIYFLHGGDIVRGLAKVNELVLSLRKKKPDASFFKMDSNSFDRNLLDNYIGGQGLFENKYIIYLDRLCEDKELKEVLLSKIKDMADPQNIFIILEGKLDKVTAGKIEKKAEKTQEFNLKEEIKPPKFNSFALADALARRDRQNSWILYRIAIDRGEAAEAIHGMLFWKVKTMLLNSSFGAYGKDGLHDLAEKLIEVHHDARSGIHELETGVERMILTL